MDKQEEIEILQEKITSLTLQLMERDEKISQLMENMKGKQLLDILLYQIMCLALQSQVVQLRDQIKSYDPQLSQKFKEVLASQHEPSSDDKLIQEESDDRVDDHDITSQSKILLFIGNLIGQSHGVFCQISDIEKMELYYSYLIVYISTDTNWSISLKAML